MIIYIYIILYIYIFIYVAVAFHVFSLNKKHPNAVKPVVFAEARFPAAATQPEILDVGFGTSEADVGIWQTLGLKSEVNRNGNIMWICHEHYKTLYNQQHQYLSENKVYTISSKILYQHVTLDKHYITLYIIYHISISSHVDNDDAPMDLKAPYF